MSEKNFPKGLYIKAVTTRHGEMLKISVNDSFIEYFNTNKNASGYLNVDVKRKKEGNEPYLELNTYVKPVDKVETQESFSDDFDDEIPF